MSARHRVDALTAASVAFALTILAHGADHIRQGTDSLTAEVYWGGAVLALINFTIIGLAITRHPRAPLLCAAVGAWTAFAVSAAHLAPHWSAFSNPYPDLSLDALSWVAMLSEVVAAAAMAGVAIAALRRNTARRPTRA